MSMCELCCLVNGMDVQSHWDPKWNGSTARTFASAQVHVKVVPQMSWFSTGQGSFHVGKSLEAFLAERSESKFVL